MDHPHSGYIDAITQESLENAVRNGEYDAGSAQLIKEERKYIRGWREARGDADNQDDSENLTGLALSGGGIRSATFSLGIMQALAGHGLLRKVDYLSTVSGGGYIGSAITWLTSTLAQEKATNNQTDDEPKAFSNGRHDFPFGTDDPRPGTQQKATFKQKRMLQYLREHGYYLTPGAGINAFSLLGAILRGTLLNLLVWIPTFVFIFLLLLNLSGPVSGIYFKSSLPAYEFLLGKLTPELPCPALTPADQATLKKICNPPAPPATGVSPATTPAANARQQDTALSLTPPSVDELRRAIMARKAFDKTTNNASSLAVFELTLWIGLLIVVGLSLLAITYSLFTWFARGETAGSRKVWYKRRRTVEKWVSIAIPVSIVSLLIGSLPLVTTYLESWIAMSGPLAIAGGIAIAIRNFLNSGDDREGDLSNALLGIGAGVFLYGVATLSYYLASLQHQGILDPTIVWVICIIAIILGWFVNLNYISIHRYYRDRLMETFMPDINNALGDRTGSSPQANAAHLHDISLTDKPHGPYHIVNTNVVLVSSEQPTYKSRGGDNFILSPLYCGSNATGWQKTERFMDGKMTLATAVAISGAAANPNTGVGGVGLTRNLFISLTMSLLNLRLGYWAEHPNPAEKPGHPPNHFRPGAYALGNAMGLDKGGYNENRCFVQLSDGGHFENMGLYELIRRRVKLAIVCDGGADPDFSFSDMQTTIRRIEDDFGARIRILDDASPDKVVPALPADPAYPKGAGFSKQGHMLGRITYAANSASEVSEGWLIFLKTALIDEVSFKVKGYKAQNPSFPDESTADQFFDEVQFEAYRELGYCIADQMLKSDMPEEIGQGKLEDLIGDCGSY